MWKGKKCEYKEHLISKNGEYGENKGRMQKKRILVEREIITEKKWNAR